MPGKTTSGNANGAGRSSSLSTVSKTAVLIPAMSFITIWTVTVWSVGLIRLRK
jgi:hypothetical protein